jgi:hypothetical protein
MIFLIMGTFTGIFFEEDVGGGFGIAIRSVVLGEFEDKLHHFGCDEELLKDGRLLPVLGEDEKLSQKLQSLKVLQRDTLLEEVAEVHWNDGVHYRLCNIIDDVMTAGE